MKRKFKPFDELTARDPWMLQTAFTYRPEIGRKTIHLFLNEDPGKLIVAEAEKSEKLTYDGRGVRYDVFFRSSRMLIDLEIQKYRQKIPTLHKREGYNRGVMLADDTKEGTEFDDLKRTVVIWICFYDPFDGEPPVTYGFTDWYHKVPDGEGKSKFVLDPWNSGVETFILNVDGNPEDAPEDFRPFMQYFQTFAAEDDLTKMLDETVKEIKTMQGFSAQYAMDMLAYNELKARERKAGKREGRKEGLLEGTVKLLASQVQDGIVTEEYAAKQLGKSVEEFRKLAEKYSAKKN